MRSQKVTFPGSAAPRWRAAWTCRMAQPRAFALFAHCFTCSKDVLAASRIARALTEHGIAVLRFDFTGLGGSDGDFANTNFTSNVADLVSAADYLRDNARRPHDPHRPLPGRRRRPGRRRAHPARPAPSPPSGHPPTPSTCCTCSRRAGARSRRPARPRSAWPSRPFRIRKQFLDDVADQPQADRIRRLGAALLVMHSPDRRDGRHRQRPHHLRRRPPPEVVRLPRRRRPPAHPSRRRPLRCLGAGVLGMQVPRRRRPPSSAPPRRPRQSRAGAGRRVRERSRPLRPTHHGRPTPAERRRADPGRPRHRPLAVRPAARRPRGLHLDDPAHVRGAQAVAPGQRHRHACATPGSTPRTARTARPSPASSTASIG